MLAYSTTLSSVPAAEVLTGEKLSINQGQPCLSLRSNSKYIPIEVMLIENEEGIGWCARGLYQVGEV